MKFREVLNFYKFANKQRDEFYNIKWRLLIIAFIVVGMWFVYSHLQTAYPVSDGNLILSSSSGTSAQASERMFNWFVTGFLAGFVAFALMFEGEFLLATIKLSKLLHLSEEPNRKKTSKTRKK
ncbi:MAG: hypothetical protein V1644_01425 [Candidatus Micrarchaeota archaeon]